MKEGPGKIKQNERKQNENLMELVNERGAKENKTK